MNVVENKAGFPFFSKAREQILRALGNGTEKKKKKKEG